MEGAEEKLGKQIIVNEPVTKVSVGSTESLVRGWTSFDGGWRPARPWRSLHLGGIGRGESKHTESEVGASGVHEEERGQVPRPEMTD